jgi:hypothetical protein
MLWSFQSSIPFAGTGQLWDALSLINRDRFHVGKLSSPCGLYPTPTQTPVLLILVVLQYRCNVELYTLATRVGEGGTGAGGTRTCVQQVPHGLVLWKCHKLSGTNRVSLALPADPIVEE